MKMKEKILSSVASASVRQGLTIVYTGEGKGKTTAAIGLALRAWGQGLKVKIIQFIKHERQTGEVQGIERLKLLMKQSGEQSTVGEDIDIFQGGIGFTQEKGTERTKHQEAAKNTLLYAQTIMESHQYDMIILDEINYAVKYHLLREEDVLSFLARKPSSVHLVLTGRGAFPALIEQADIVTEMKLIKHAYAQGIRAQKGIEF